MMFSRTFQIVLKYDFQFCLEAKEGIGEANQDHIKKTQLGPWQTSLSQSVSWKTVHHC